MLFRSIGYHERDFEVTAEEVKVREYYENQARQLDKKINNLPKSYFDEKKKLELELAEAKANSLSLKEIKNIEKKLATYPVDPGHAYEYWLNEKRQAYLKSQVTVPSMDPMKGVGEGVSSLTHINFILLIFCLMCGTASLPHILTRFYTTTGVNATRYSVFWTLLFVLIFYLSVPAMAAMVKLDLFKNLVGISYADLPNWVNQWRKIEP